MPELVAFLFLSGTVQVRYQLYEFTVFSKQQIKKESLDKLSLFSQK